MKTIISFIGLILLFFVIGFLESPKEQNGGMPIIKSETNEEIEEASSQIDGDNVTSYTSLEYILEEKNEIDGYIVETYREYEIYEDENGVVIKKVPTSNFDMIRYKK